MWAVLASVWAVTISMHFFRTHPRRKKQVITAKALVQAQTGKVHSVDTKIKTVNTIIKHSGNVTV